MQGADRDAPPRLEVGVDQAVQHHTAHVLWGWALGESLTLADAPRCTLHMMYNAVSPFIAFFEVLPLFTCLPSRAMRLSTVFYPLCLIVY